MSGVYAESSAVVAWLLDQPSAPTVSAVLTSAEQVVASDLTIVEVERSLIRAWSLHVLSEVQRSDRSAALSRASAGWTRMPLNPVVIDRTYRPFPIEPMRSVDAIHLASALVARAAVPGLRVLTLDQRIRENAERLGFEVVP